LIYPADIAIKDRITIQAIVPHTGPSMIIFDANGKYVTPSFLIVIFTHCAPIPTIAKVMRNTEPPTAQT
jgi:hypothetical protein